MENLYTIKKAAKLAGTTAETLRHYDRIGLVSPCSTDKWTGYRYYSPSDIVKISTIRALQSMDFSLGEIRDILQVEDFGKVVGMLDSALERADRKIAELQEAKQKILRARSQYAGKREKLQPHGGIYERVLPQRTILLSANLSTPTVENLTGYHRHFFAQLGKEIESAFSFEDAAGIYTVGNSPRMFAVCKTYTDAPGLVMLPAGQYLCRRCTDKDRADTERELAALAEERTDAKTEFIVSVVAITGILKWEYEVQAFTGK